MAKVLVNKLDVFGGQLSCTGLRFFHCNSCFSAMTCMETMISVKIGYAEFTNAQIEKIIAWIAITVRNDVVFDATKS